MNPYAYRIAGIAVKALSNLSRAKIRVHDAHNIPKGAVIFAINHFTRIETMFIPYYINKLTGLTLWSLADYTLFEGGLGNILDRVGAVSTHNPHRDLLMVKTLLTGEAAWIIFPEGRMVKTKKIFQRDGTKKGEFIVSSPEGKHPPHTGTATLALRTQFYRQRIRRMIDDAPEEALRLLNMYQIEHVRPVLDIETYIVPVNLTYYPIRARENILSRMAELFIGDLSERMTEEIFTEGTMLLSGVDVDMRFGKPIRIGSYLKSGVIQGDIRSTEPIGFDDPIPSRSMMRKTARKIMERYMSSIYSMTTVNHDHLLAALLKYLPENEIDEDDFRRRAYLAATLDLKRLGIHRHESLDGSQIHLLTDDRYNKIGNFISLAIEKHVLKKEENRLVKDPALSEPIAFHRIRIDNPVAVVTNEIEPLAALNQRLRDIARQPCLRIKYRLRRYLIQKGKFDFERDYTRFAIEGESKEKSVGSPFLIKGKSRDLGIVLVHGYMAAPLEIRALAEYLGNLGYWVYAPRLKGHGTAPEDLATRKYIEWVEDVEEGYAIIGNICKRVVAGGFSNGAGLALDLCTRVKGLSGVFAISPPMKLQDFSARFIPAVSFWNTLMKKMNVESIKMEFVENTPENPHINYSRNPVAGVRELERVMDQLETKLPGIQIPALLVQSLLDPVVSPDGSLKIFRHLGSADKEYFMINSPHHGIVNGEGADRVFAMVGDFLGRISAGAGPILSPDPK